MSIRVSKITSSEHLEFIASVSSVSFLQTPAWGKVKPDWRSESVGFFDGTELVGAGLILYRQVPKLKRYLAYLPEGPTLRDWSAANEALPALVDYCRSQKSFAVRVGPAVVHRRWGPATIKAAIADEEITRLSQVTPDSVTEEGTALKATLEKAGWQAQISDSGFAAGQPQFNFQLPLAGKDEAAVLKGMNQLWRRNIKKATKLGVEVRTGDRADLAEFHQLYVETAERDRFTPRPLHYFETMWDALRAEDPDRIRVYLAHYQDTLIAATTWVRVGTHTWYSYGASSNQLREARGSNAIQWQMIQDSLAAGADVYDLRGITEGVGKDDPEIGLIQFKVGTGGEAVSYLGEWDFPISRVLYLAFNSYLKWRSK